MKLTLSLEKDTLVHFHCFSSIINKNRLFKKNHIVKHKFLTMILFSTLLFVVSACTYNQKIESIPEAKEYLGRELWTATNLHISQKQNIYWQNYLTEEIFPVGTAIRIKHITDTTIIFVDNYNNEYTLHWKNDQKDLQFKEVFHKYFRVSSPDGILENMSEELISGISLGEVKRGMRKEYVLLSLGYPINKNPREKNIWIYWETRTQKRAVYFENNRVTEIVYNVSVQ